MNEKRTKPAAGEFYISRGGLKLASVAQKLRLSFPGKTVLDIGSSTGGFTDFALKNGAKKVIAIDKGTNQLHPLLRSNKRVDLQEKSDFLSVSELDDMVDCVLIDVSFVSIRKILTHLSKLISKNTQIVAMVKPQFEALPSFKRKGVVKNETMRRAILKDFDMWVRGSYKIIAKADSSVEGQKGNKERFYLLSKLS